MVPRAASRWGRLHLPTTEGGALLLRKRCHLHDVVRLEGADEFLVPDVGLATVGVVVIVDDVDKVDERVEGGVADHPAEVEELDLLLELALVDETRAVAIEVAEGGVQARILHQHLLLDRALRLLQHRSSDTGAHLRARGLGRADPLPPGSDIRLLFLHRRGDLGAHRVVHREGVDKVLVAHHALDIHVAGDELIGGVQADVVAPCGEVEVAQTASNIRWRQEAVAVHVEDLEPLVQLVQLLHERVPSQATLIGVKEAVDEKGCTHAAGRGGARAARIEPERVSAPARRARAQQAACHGHGARRGRRIAEVRARNVVVPPRDGRSGRLVFVGRLGHAARRHHRPRAVHRLRARAARRRPV